MSTKLLYLTDSYKKTCSAKIISIEIKGGHAQVVLDQTIFYPQGGGQPSDQGSISTKNGQLAVSQVTFSGENPVHLGILHGNLKAGDRVKLTINWQRRYQNMQSHTAGHILDEAVKLLFPEIYGVTGCHGLSGQLYITFQGLIDQSQKSAIKTVISDIVASKLPIVTTLTTKSKLLKNGIRLPFKLPDNKPLRTITIGSFPPTPDGGTQLENTAQLWPIQLGKFSYEKGCTIIPYELTQPKSKTAPLHPKNTLSLTEFTALNQSFLQTAQSVKTWDQNLITKYLGKKGLFNTQLASQIKFINASDKRAAGQTLNLTKASLQSLIAGQEASKNQSRFLDLTKPGTLPPIGHLHPITQAIQEITQIFKAIGFSRVRYPEIDYDKYVFESLNMPPGHPARDEWETFFIDRPKHPAMGGMVLTTHTSNGQVREMERVKTPPIRMLNLGKCYRRQQDVTHTAMFHQFEGLVIDQGINIQHLKGTLDYFARHFYGPTARSRIRPFMFKFTEPSFEVDFSCTMCNGQGKIDGQTCRFCKSGWHEVGGAGMVHPNVLKAGGIDPEKFTGFAFGWGVERVYTLKPGLHLDDIRPLYSTNLQFLNQF